MGHTWMTDRYQSLAATPVGRFVVKNLGLPNPPRLRRHQPDAAPVEGLVLLGGSGRLAGSLGKQLDDLGAATSTDRREGTRYRGLVFDATGLTEPSQLGALQEFFTPVLRSLESSGRVVVLGTPPEATGSESERIAQRALEGFTRSLAKEVGRGSTCQLVYVTPGTDDAALSTVAFCLSAKSAYVSGQVIRIGTHGAGDLPRPRPSQPLEGRVALVTGASRGIGESIARTLHRDGATVVGVDVPQMAEELQRLMTELGGHTVLLDITAKDAPQRIAQRLSEFADGVDVVVHNAGITRDKKLANMKPEGWSAVLGVNLIAPQRITEELLTQQLIRPGGAVVGVASIAGIAGNAGQTNYATSKAGVIGFVDALAPRAAAQQVTVNAVAPGFIETAMTAKIPLLLREAGRRMNSMSQGGLPVDVAETVAWLADPASAGVSGNTVRVCGQSLLGA